MPSKIFMNMGMTGDYIATFTEYESEDAAKKAFENSGNDAAVIVSSWNKPEFGHRLGVDFLIVAAWGTRTNGWRTFAEQPREWGEVWA